MIDLTSTTAILELIAVVLNIIYVVLAAREKIACWYFGTVGSAIGIYVTFVMDLPGQSLLYVYYTAMSVYGWYKWRQNKSDGESAAIHWFGLKKNAIAIVGGAALTTGLYYLINGFFEQEIRALDLATVVFSLIGMYLITIKVIDNWIYWIVIDAASLYLYFTQELYFYAILFIVYMIISVYGLIKWQKHIATHASWNTNNGP